MLFLLKKSSTNLFAVISFTLLSVEIYLFIVETSVFNDKTSVFNNKISDLILVNLGSK